MDCIGCRTEMRFTDYGLARCPSCGMRHLNGNWFKPKRKGNIVELEKMEVERL